MNAQEAFFGGPVTSLIFFCLAVVLLHIVGSRHETIAFLIAYLASSLLSAVALQLLSDSYVSLGQGLFLTTTSAWLFMLICMGFFRFCDWWIADWKEVSTNEGRNYLAVTMQTVAYALGFVCASIFFVWFFGDFIGSTPTTHDEYQRGVGPFEW